MILDDILLPAVVFATVASDLLYLRFVGCEVRSRRGWSIGPHEAAWFSANALFCACVAFVAVFVNEAWPPTWTPTNIAVGILSVYVVGLLVAACVFKLVQHALNAGGRR